MREECFATDFAPKTRTVDPQEYGLSVHRYVDVLLLLNPMPIRTFRLAVGAASRYPLAIHLNDVVIALINKVARMKRVEIQEVMLVHTSGLFFTNRPVVLSMR